MRKIANQLTEIQDSLKDQISPEDRSRLLIENCQVRENIDFLGKIHNDFVQQGKDLPKDSEKSLKLFNNFKEKNTGLTTENAKEYGKEI